MSRRPFQKRGKCQRRRGLSLVEVVVSTMLVGLVLVSAMKCLGGVIRGRMSTSDSGRGEQLAQQLLTEIFNTDYEDGGGSPVFGREPNEFTGSNRSDFDDVDDFHNWTAAPPEDRNGNAVFNTSGWQRDVTVQLVDPADPATVSGTDQGLKRITVTVRHDGLVVTELVTLRSDNTEYHE